MLAVYQGANDRQYAAVDAADTFSTRPDFNVVMYGGGFADFRTNALRPDIASRLDKTAPPMFVAHAYDDAALSSIILAGALKRARVPHSELHVFAAGAHGFGVRESGLPVAHWRELCLDWLAGQGFLDSAAVRAYAKSYLAAYDGGAAKLPRFSAGKNTAGIADAFAAQQRLVRHALAGGDAVAGYKGAFTSDAAQKSFGIAQPLHGVLFKSGRLDAAATKTIVVDPKRPLIVETEIGYVIAVDIGTKLRVPRQAVTTVEAVVPVIELPINTGALMDGHASAADLVATNVGSYRYLVGAPLAPEKAGDFDALRVSLQRDGQTLHESTGADVKGGQAENLMALINQIVDQGHVLHRGDIVICGALGGGKPGAKGRYVADYGALGKIEFTLE
jgi:2-keto-4-pentenoate hydratase